MSALFAIVSSLQFASPFFLLLPLPLLYLALFGLRLPSIGEKKQGGGVAVSALQDTSGIGTSRASRVRNIRFISFFFILVLLGALLAMPSIQTGSATTVSRKTTPLRTLIVVFDISGSMKNKLGGSDESKFNIARDALVVFLSAQENMRVGIIFFGTWPFQYRTPLPPDYIDALVHDLQSIEFLKNAPWGLGERQLSSLPGATETTLALAFASNVIEGLPLADKKSRAVILISDLEDFKQELVDAAEELSSANIRLFVISIRPKSFPATTKELTLSAQSHVDVFVVSSPEEIAGAYGAISEITREQIVVHERISTRQDVSWNVALALATLGIFFVFSVELLFRRMRTGG